MIFKTGFHQVNFTKIEVVGSNPKLSKLIFGPKIDFFSLQNPKRVPKVCHKKNWTGSLSYYIFSFWLINAKLNSAKHWYSYAKNETLEAQISYQGAEIYAKT